VSDRVTSRVPEDARNSRNGGCHGALMGTSDRGQPKARFAAFSRGLALVLLAGALLAACGGSSSSTNSTGGSGGTRPTAAGGNASSGASAGRVDTGDAGEPSGANAGSGSSGGDGGARSLPDEPQLGAACERGGALSCADAHQKLTLVCSAAGKWETNQTCPSGQFCSSTAGPDLGICKAPEADCAARQPGDTFCASDSITLMQCDVDGITAAQAEQCQAGCIEGACAPARPCPANIVYSCDPGCPGPNTNPSCFELCPTPASGISPLLELSDVVHGGTYAIALPAVASDSQPCSCVEADGSLQGVVFRVPNPPSGSRWRFTYPTTWEFHSDITANGETNDYYKSCQHPWPGYSSITPGCATVRPESTTPLIWLSANAPVTEPATVFVELLPNADATCAP
jgi:hypothetical protein